MAENSDNIVISEDKDSKKPSSINPSPKNDGSSFSDEFVESPAKDEIDNIVGRNINCIVISDNESMLKSIQTLLVS